MAVTGQQKLEQELIEWATAQADRDNLIRAALAAGVTKQRVHQLTGIARTTIDRIIGIDSESWTCTGCGGQFIGHRTPGDRCRYCATARATSDAAGSKNTTEGGMNE